MEIPSYTFYKSEYFGNKLSSEQFLTWSHRAADYISSITFGKSKTSSLIEVKKAICAVADVLYDEEMSGGTVLNESVSGQSVSYDSASVRNKKYNVAARYLAQTGLLYRGGVCIAP